MQSLGGNKTGYYAENKIFSTDENFQKKHVCLHWFLYSPDNVGYCYEEQC